MNNLLDTHTLIWFLNGSKDLSAKAKKAFENKESINFVSIASLWEMAIKISLGKLELTISFSKIAGLIKNNGFHILPISFDDILLLSNLPFHHRDPFDRIMITQSISNKLTIISKDNQFGAYDVLIIW